MSCKIDPILITDSLNTAREKINDVYTGRTEIWSGGTGFQSIVSRGDDTNSTSSDYSVILGGKNNIITGGTKNSIIGGNNNLIKNNSTNSAIIGGENNILSGTLNSVIVGGSNITGVTDNTTFVPELESTGNRVRSVRYVELIRYEPDETDKIEPVVYSDEILLITDSTPNSGVVASTDMSLDLRFMATDDQVGRTVELVILNNSGHVGGVLLGSLGGDYKINSESVNARLLVLTGNLFQHVTVTYLGPVIGGTTPWFAVTGTGV